MGVLLAFYEGLSDVYLLDQAFQEVRAVPVGIFDMRLSQEVAQVGTFRSVH